MMHKQSEEARARNADLVLISAPVDPEFEMFMLGCARFFLENLRKSRFATSAEEDLRDLRSSTGSSLPAQRKRLALAYRLEQKRILDQNIEWCGILFRIVSKVF